MRQDLATTVQFDRITDDYSAVVQAAGLPVTIIDICRADAASPEALRRALVCQLRDTLPSTVSLSIRATPSPQMSGDWLAQTEGKVKNAIFEAAHDSPTLRPVVSKDRAGREQVEYFGRKSVWMDRYKAPAMLTKTISGQPVRLPVIVS